MKKYAVVMILLTGALVYGENIDPYGTGQAFGWSENTGWANFSPGAGPGVHVEGDKVTGYVWCENIGWLNLSCHNTGTCGVTNFGVVNDGSGNLSGFAWAENAGWVNFDPEVPGDAVNQYRVRIDAAGLLSGWAWGENIGWIHFDAVQSWDVQVCVVTLEDLANFAGDWLVFGNPPANLNGDRSVTLEDYSIFASWWLDYCPNGWQLKQ